MDGPDLSYERIMGISSAGSEHSSMGGAKGLSSRLVTFRRWLSDDAKIEVHPALCIVNGEATDGTKNAPVLVFEPPPSVATSNSQTKAPHPATGRCGVVDNTAEHALYDRTMGCQIRTVREVRKGDVVMKVPRSAMITPDVVASSDAGRAVLACCQSPPQNRLGEGEPLEFWDVFSNTTEREHKFSGNLSKSNGTQLLVKILQERKKAETSLSKALRRIENLGGDSSEALTFSLASPGVVSSRAPLLAFLIQQRFSNETRPAVNMNRAAAELSNGVGSNNALRTARTISLDDSPETFAPYARILPSAISLPLCWKRNELALLAGCIPGVPLLQEVAAHTMQLSSEFVALVDAGIIHRFPHIFSPGLLTWERWVWAAAVISSRTLPVSCYTNMGDANAVAHFESNPNEEQAIKSSPGVWDELGILIPLLDMLNHEVDSNQITWEPRVPEGRGTPAEDDSGNAIGSPPGPHGPRAVMHKRVKKGSEVYTAYDVAKSNKELLLSYGFAQMNNPDDKVKIGWTLSSSVGNVPAPGDYTPHVEEGETPTSNHSSRVYESMDVSLINAWWSPERLSLLEGCACITGEVLSGLKLGQKLEGMAYADGRFHPSLLSAAVVGTMPPSDVKKYSSEGPPWSLTKKHQRMLRHYLVFFFSRKLEKLLQNLNNGLKDHFGAQLCTKMSEGGLQYNDDKEGTEGELKQGWQSFFDSTAYTWSLEVEKNFYAMGPDSCVLTLYDGHLRALQVALDCVSSEESFGETVLQRLKELDFNILDIEGESNPESLIRVSAAMDDTEPAPDTPNGTPRKERGKEGGKGGRRRNRKRGDRALSGDRPPAIKLHIGNLAYSTSVSDLLDFFGELYGREHILECQIPTERDSGKSRGFGFVTMPEAVASGALQSGRKHEIDGRLLKVERSNSAGSSKASRPQASSDRCSTCGYRPKYCVCSAPNATSSGPSTHQQDKQPRAEAYGDPYRDRGHDHFGSRHRSRGYSYSPPRDRGYRGYRDDGREYGYDRDYRHRSSRSHSRGRDKDRRRDRERRRDRGRSLSRERGSTERSRSVDREGRSRRPRYSRSRSYSGERPSRRDRKSGDGLPEVRSRSGSPHLARSGGNGADLDRKRDGSDRKRSRSWDRGKSGKRKRSKKDRRSARSRSASPGAERHRSNKS